MIKLKINLLRSEIAKQNLSTSEFLKLISMNKSTWSKKSRGINYFNQGEIQSIINVLNLSESQVMDIFFEKRVS